MNRSLIKALILLPGTVLVLIPAVILFFTGVRTPDTAPTLTGLLCFWSGLALAAAGLALAIWCMVLFRNLGHGTPAPWQPPRRLVVQGPYGHVRNPMITGVLLMLAAEALLWRSWALALWGILFFLGNALYFPLVEERGLVKRFGDDYREYASNVPRWIPRRRPWEKDPQKAGDDST